VSASADTLNVNSLLSALIGGGLALAGTFLAARLERKAKQDETKTQLQHATLMELQDALEIFFRETYAIHLWRDLPNWLARKEKEIADLFPEQLKKDQPPVVQDPNVRAAEILQKLDQEEHFKDVSSHLKTWTDTRFRIEKLIERIDNQALRDDVAALIAVTRPVLTEPVWDQAEVITKRLNALIGQLFRDGVVTDKGFVVREKSP